MAISTRIHMDCRNYAPLDVTKGICHRTKDLVLADDLACDAFHPIPRCKLCRHFLPSDKPLIGVCAAEAGQPMAYPDLIAVTCEWFESTQEAHQLDG